MGAVANTNLSFGVAEILSLISIVLSAVFTMVSLILFFLYDRKLKRLQEKELIFKRSPYPYITGMYINPENSLETEELTDDSGLLYSQKLCLNDLEEEDIEWIKNNQQVFEYRYFSGENCFVWKMNELSDRSYVILHCANTIVIKNYGETMVSAKILELRMYESLRSKKCATYKGAGTVYRILEKQGSCDTWVIPNTFVSCRVDSICESAKPYIGKNVLEETCPQNVTGWAKLEIDIEVQNRMRESMKYTLRVVNSERQTYTETIPL